MPIETGGSRQPFFCVHTLDGDVVSYAELARLLGPEQPFYGLRAQGLGGEKLPYARIEDMAAYYIEQVRTIQPEGPYLLGGMCFGGVVAFEMAQQFQAQGQELALLALMDTPRPPYGSARFLFWRFERFCRRLRGSIRHSMRRPIRHLRNLSRLSPVHWSAYVREKAGIAKEVAVDRSSPRAERFRAGRLTEANRAVVDKANQRAMQRYSPRSYSGRISLFLIGQPGARRFTNIRMGWAELASDGVEVYLVPGDHLTSLKEPNVRILAGKLRASLLRAQSVLSSGQHEPAL